MSKNEFLKELRDYLTGQISAAEVEESVKYYDQYIRDQVAGGISEREAVERLGDPRIIGRSIVDAAARKKAEGSAASRSTSYQEQKDASSSRSSGKNSSSHGTVNSGKLKLYGTLAIILLVVIVILVAITKVIAFFFPLIIVVILATYVMKHWGDGR